jgi:hypothetical protein
MRSVPTCNDARRRPPPPRPPVPTRRSRVPSFLIAIGVVLLSIIPKVERCHMAEAREATYRATPRTGAESARPLSVSALPRHAISRALPRPTGTNTLMRWSRPGHQRRAVPPPCTHVSVNAPTPHRTLTRRHPPLRAPLLFSGRACG